MPDLSFAVPNYLRPTGTYTGHYEPVKEMADLLDEYEAKTGHSVPIHGNVIYY